MSNRIERIHQGYTPFESAIERRGGQPIIPETVDFTIHDPEMVRERFGPFLAFAGGVEGEVANSANLARTLLPCMRKDLQVFFKGWELEEDFHAKNLAIVRDMVNVPAMEIRETVPNAYQPVRKVSERSSTVHNTAEYVVISYFGLGELETWQAYKTVEIQLEESGEPELAHLMQRIAKQERGHLGDARGFAANRRQESVSPKQLSVVKGIMEHQYMPVGVRKRDPERRKRFGQMASLLLDGDPVETVTRPVEDLAEELFGKPVTPFLSRRYTECIEEYAASGGII